MQVSKIELEQMAKDGKGRASVVKYLAEQVLQGSTVKFEASADTRQEVAKFFQLAVEEFPSTMMTIIEIAKSMADRKQWSGSAHWWRHFRDALPAAAKQIL